MSPEKKKQSSEDTAQPHSLEAEVAILGVILINNPAYAIAAEMVSPDDFYLPKHVLIFSAMQQMYARQEPIDLVTLIEVLRQESELEAAGDMPYIASLADGMPRETNVMHYARIVKEKSLLRSLIHAAHKMTLRAFAAEDTASDIIGEVKSALATISEGEPTRGLIPVRTLVKENYDRLDAELTEGRTITGIATGYPTLDKYLRGMHAGELIVLAARPSVGKSSLGLNIIRNVVEKGIPMALFSLEMSADSILLRLVAEMFQINIRNGAADAEDYKRVTNGLVHLCTLPLWIDDNAGTTIAQISARAERAVKEYGVKAIVIDYLQLVTSNRRRFGNRQEEVSEISRTLKVTAKNLGIPILALSQLTRGPEKEGRQPQLSDLRESGAIEQDADVVMFLHRPKQFEEGSSKMERDETNLIIGKQRNGPTATIRMIFLEEFTRFEERAPDMFDQG